MTIQPDGKIVVSGVGFTVARYNSDGSLDNSFSHDGVQTIEFPPGDYANGDDVAVQPDGRIVVAGSAYERSGAETEGNAPSDFALARLLPDGSLDPSFSGDGKQTTDFGGDDVIRGVALQSNGKIVAIGDTGRFAPPATTPTARSTARSRATAC